MIFGSNSLGFGVIVWILLALGLGALPAGAQVSDTHKGSALGQLYLSFEPGPRSSVLGVSPFRPFRFYLVASVDFANAGLAAENLRNGIGGWEAGIELPEAVVVIERRTPGACCPLGCVDKQGTQDDWFVELCGASVAAASPIVLVEYLAMLTEANAVDVPLGITTPETSIIGTPGWREQQPSGECGEYRCVRPFRPGWQELGLRQER